MTGATLALALSRLSHGRLPVAIAEAKRPDDSHSGFDAWRLRLLTAPVSGWTKSVCGLI